MLPSRYQSAMLCVSVILTKACTVLQLTWIINDKYISTQVIHPPFENAPLKNCPSVFYQLFFFFTWISSTPSLVREQKLDAVLQPKTSIDSSVVAFATGSGQITFRHRELLCAREPFHMWLQTKYFLCLKTKQNKKQPISQPKPHRNMN